MVIDRISELIFEPSGHTYQNVITGKYLISVSQVISKLKSEFDSESISYAISKRSGISQEKILQEWEDIRIRSCDYGSLLHECCENTILLNRNFNFRKAFQQLKDIRGSEFTSTFDDFISALRELRSSISHYTNTLSEFRIFEPKFGVAGTMDILLQRGEGDYITVDIDDFKTNIENAIQFDSIKRENGIIMKDYGRRMKYPVNHLEDCNYNHYALQLSMYALMVENWFKVRIGKLTIRYIDGNMKWTYIPVPYMKYEAIEIFKYATKMNFNGDSDDVDLLFG